jgi:hypothetical protein
MTMKTIRLTEDEMRVLELALETYIRIGLGQFSEIAQRLHLIHGDRLKEQRMERIRQLCEEAEELTWDDGRPWTLHDPETSRYILTAFGLEARMAGNTKNAKWAARRIREKAAFEPLDRKE